MQILDVMEVRYPDDTDVLPTMRVSYSSVYTSPEVTLIEGENVTVVSLGTEFDEEGNPLAPLVRFTDNVGGAVFETEGYVLAKYLVPAVTPESPSPSASNDDLISGVVWWEFYENG